MASSRHSSNRLVIAAGSAAALLLITFSARWGLSYDLRPRPYLVSDLALAACFAAIGLVAYAIRPRSSTARGLLALGLVMALATPYGLAPAASAPGALAVKVVGEPAYWLQFAIAGHLLLGYPTGRVPARGARRLLAAGYLVAAIGSGTAIAALITTGRVGRPYRVISDMLLVAWSVLGIVLVALIVRRTARALPRRRRVTRPAVFTAIAATVTLIGGFLLIAGTGMSSDKAAVLYSVIAWAAAVALPFVFLSDVIREKLALAAVGELVHRLRDSGAEGLEQTLGTVLRDPTLRLAFPGGGGLVTLDGRPFQPAGGPRSALTDLGDPPVAVLEHDAGLTDDEPAFRFAAAAAHLALDHARLYAQVQAQLREIQASRLRIARAADAERQRVERDLHDGAQQRLIAIVYRLTALHLDAPDAAWRERVAAVQDDVRAAITELRSLAHGLRPPILTDQGIGPAVSALARRAPTCVAVRSEATARYHPAVEATAYYVVSEALQNIGKHAEGAAAVVRIDQQGDTLVVEVSDDGPGGTSIMDGTGLLGLADRVGAIGGRLTVESPAGAGTTVRAELPCES